MTVDLDAEVVKLVLELHRLSLTAVMREHDRAHKQLHAPERVDKPQHVEVVGNAEVAAYLVLFESFRADDNDDFRLFLEVKQHFELAVGLKSRQNSRSVIVVEQLAAKLEVQLAAELVDALANFL